MGQWSGGPEPVQGCKVALDKLHRATSIAITKAFRTAVMAATENMLRLEPHDIFIKLEAMPEM